MTPSRVGIKALLACVLLVSQVGSHTAIAGWEIDAKGLVTRVIDGDTFDVDSVGRIRLADIDTAEIGKPGAAEATAYLTGLVFRQLAYLDVDDLAGSDRYGRLVAVAYVRHNATHLLNVNQALLEAGHARVWDFPNEFEPTTWSLYVNHSTDGALVTDGLNRDQAVAVFVLVANIAAGCIALPLLRGRKVT